MTKTDQDVLVEELHHLYDAEKKLVQVLPEMAKAAQSPRLRAGFQAHLRATQKHLQRLGRMMKKVTVTPVSQSCHAIQQLIAEGEKTLQRQSELFAEFVQGDDFLRLLPKH